MLFLKQMANGLYGLSFPAMFKEYVTIYTYIKMNISSSLQIWACKKLTDYIWIMLS